MALGVWVVNTRYRTAWWYRGAWYTFGVVVLSAGCIGPRIRPRMDFPEPEPRFSPEVLSTSTGAVEGLRIGVAVGMSVISVTAHGTVELMDEHGERAAWMTDGMRIRLTPAGTAGVREVFRVALGAFRDEVAAMDAVRKARELLGDGVPVDSVAEDGFYKVRAGYFTVREEAAVLVTRCVTLGYRDAWIHRGEIAAGTDGSGVVEARGDAEGWGGRRFASGCVMVPRTPETLIEINGVRYRGRVSVRNTGGTLSAINVLPMEEYLRGVVPREIGTTAPLEALKAQAIAARTAAFTKLGKHGTAGFDLCATVCCQVYGGASAEHSRTDEAVRATAGEVLVYSGRIADTPYHACCGGVTEDAATVWGFSRPYLRAVTCSRATQPPEVRSERGFRNWLRTPPRTYCSDHVRFRWTVRVPAAELSVILKSKGFNIGEPREIRLGERGPGGTLRSIVVRGTSGETRADSEYRIRQLLGSVMTFYSGKFIVRRESSAAGPVFVFEGAGWGHGVGMCQSGAAGMAADGWSYRRILTHYYPGTEVRRLY